MDDSEAFLLPYLPVLQTCWIPPAQMDRTCEASGIAMHKPEQFSAHTAPTSPLNLGTRAECRNRGLCKSPPELVPLSGHKPFPGSSCSQMSMGRTGNENIVLRWFLSHNPQLIPSPRLPVLSDQHRNFPLSPCGYNTCIFHSEFKISSSAAKLGNLSQWSLPSCCFQQHFCPSASPLGMGFPPWPARVTGNQENPSTWAQVGLGAVLGWLLAAG